MKKMLKVTRFVFCSMLSDLGIKSMHFFVVLWISTFFNLYLITNSYSQTVPAGFELVAYEGFNYGNNTSMNTQNGGSGWTAPWANGVTNDLKTETPGLTYSGLTTVGGKLAWGNSPNQVASASRTLPLQNSGIVYLQMITDFRSSSGGGTDNLRLLVDNQLSGAIGGNGNPQTINLLDNNLTSAGATTTPIGDLSLVIVQLDYIGNTTKIWINSNLSTFDYFNPGVPQASMNYAITFNKINPVFRSGAFLDEITIFRRVEGLLTITSAGESGTSGTNWSLSSSNNLSTLTVTGTASVQASVLETALASGDLNVVGNTNNFQVTVNQNISVNSGTGNLTFGSSTTTGSFTLNNPITLSGALSVYGGDITVNGNINTTAGNANGDILFKASGDIVQSASKTITTNGGDVIFWANSDGETTNGSVLLRNQSAITTNGGHVWMGGGSGSTTWNGLTVGNGLAVSGTTYSTPVSSAIYESGIYLEKATIQSGGGNVYLAGSSTGTDGAYDFGILTHDVSSINSGSGTITIKGGTGSSTVRGLVVGVQYSNQPGSLTLTSASTQATAIDVEARSASNFGLAFEGEFSLISTQSGGINFTTIGSTAGTRLGFSTNPGTLNVLAASGPIVVNTGASGFDKGSLSSTTQKAFFGAKVGTSVTSSSSNIQFISDDLDELDELNFATSGTLTVEPSATSFAAALNSSSLNQTGLSGLTLGKAGNTAAITIGSSTTVAGPVSLLGGEITVDGNINTAAGNANGDVLLKGTGNIIQNASKTITTNGGDVTFWADSDGNGSGYVQASASSSISSGGGNVVLGGGSNLATGYARGAATLDNTNNVYISGVHLMSNTTINSSGGNITLRGQNIGNSGANVQAGIMGMNTTLNAGAGKISLVGIAGGSGTANAQGISIKDINTGWTIRSSNPDSDAISLVGDASSTSNSYTSLGINFIGTIESTGGGGVILDGKAGPATNYDHGLDVRGNILANSGAITLIGQNDVASQFGIYVDASSSIGFKAATNVTASTSNLVFKSDYTSFITTTNLNTTGTVSIVPLDASTSFGVAQTGANMVLGAGVSGLTIGKAGNTAGITIGSATSVAGPVSVYGGDITVDGNINTSAGNANGDVLLKATGSITQNSNRSITTSGGDVVFWADADANQGGDIFFGATSTYTSPASIQTGGGHIWLGGGSGSTTWNGLTVGDGYAVGASNRTVGGSFTHTNGITIQATILNSGGGDIYLKGKGKPGDSPSAYSGGMYLLGAGAMNSGGGDITIEALSNTGSGNKYGLYNLGAYTFAPGAGNLSITGDASASSATSGGSVTGRGIFFWTSMSPIVSSGNISLTGVKSSANDTHGIDIRTAITTTGGNLSLSAESLSLASSLSASGNLTLTTTSPLTYTHALTANLLNLLGNGASYALTNTSNNAARLTANTGAINYVDSNALTLGQITATGDVQIATQTGDLTIDGNLSSAATTTSAVVLNAGKSAAIGTTTGGNILVTGTPTLTTGTGGIAKLFSGSDGSSTGLISLVGGVVNARLAVDETTTSFSPALSAGGSYALFRALSNAPVFSNLAGDAVTYLLENNPVALDANSNAQVTDSDSPDFNGGVLTVSFASNTGIAAEDRLGVTNQGLGAGQIGISGSNVLFQGVTLGTFAGGTAGANLVITLNATATPTTVQALLRALNYSNSNRTLSIGSGNRQVAITLTDGDGGTSATATVTISIVTSRTLSILSGNNQTAAVNQVLPEGPVLQVMGSNGAPAANATLTVTANAGQIRLPVLSNLSDTYTTGGSRIDNINWKSQQFTTGNTAVILDQVALLLNKAAASSYPSTVQVEASIYTVNNFGVPGIEIGTSGIQSAVLPAATTWKTMVFTSPIELSPNTSYALVVKGSNSTGFIWGNVRSSSTGPTGWAAFVNSKTTDGSITNWVDGAVRNAFILTGSTPLSATQTLVTNSDGTAALGSWVLGDRAGTQELLVTNGNLLGSPLTITATAAAVVPSAPTGLSYSPGNGQVSLSFTPGYDGGSVVTNYEYSLDNGSSWTALNPADTSSPVTITGLTNGTTYPVKIRAVNTAGQGAASAAISVNSVIPLTNQSITVDPIANQTYTGAALTPALVVKDGNTTLTATTDYTVSYTNNTNVGTATVTITGAGNYSGTKTQTFAIVAKAASTLTIDAIANQTYTGSALTPAVVVKDGNTTLTATTDYTVAYTNNTNVGTATVTITGAGNYTGTKTQTFTIAAKAASTLTIDAIANQTYTGSALTPAVVVKDGNTTLTATTDYTVAYTNNTNVGTATVTITGAGNYTGTKTQTFTIAAKAASTLTIDAIANQTYTGSALTPAVVVKDGNTTLTATTDYTVAYSNNTNVGTATVTITGTGNYSGTKTQTFAIVAKAASTLTIDAIANQTYTGSALTPAVVVKDGNTTLTATTDYTVAYSNNTNVGTATVTITGAGNYSGTKTQTFTIVAKSASTLTLDAIANQTYTGSALTPALVVKDGSTTLTATTDYTVAYTNNTNVGTATVTITGAGSYSGTKTQTFAIQPKALTIRAVNTTKIYGDANPSLGFTYSGLVDGDAEIDQAPSISTTATTTSGVGTYRIILTGGSDPNYTLTRVEGVLEVTPANLVVTVNGATKIYGQADPVYTYSIQGLKGADTEVILRGALTRETGEEPGNYRISAGTLSAGANYTLSVTGANLQIVKARALAVAELGLITTEWSKEAALPATVNLLATHGQYFRVEVKWDKSKLNLLARGTYSLTGTLILPAGIENPDQILAKTQVQVLPKAAPLDVTLNNNSFVGSTSTYFIPVGAFVVNDPADKIHTVSLNGPGYDNKYFVILNNILYWNSADLAAGKTTFSIIVRVTDRDGNTLDKFFEITRSRPSISDIIIYNSFSPNGDGFNDSWGIEAARFYSGTKLQIFDRGGVRVFNTEDPSQRWDGTYQGKELPIGTYYWILEVGETGEMRRGVLNVMRK